MKEKYKKGRDYPYVGLKVTSLRTVVAFRRETEGQSLDFVCEILILSSPSENAET